MALSEKKHVEKGGLQQPLIISSCPLIIDSTADLLKLVFWVLFYCTVQSSLRELSERSRLINRHFQSAGLTQPRLTQTELYLSVLSKDGANCLQSALNVHRGRCQGPANHILTL